MTTALNMSWSSENPALPEVLKKLPSVPIGNDGAFNYQCFLNVIKKHTGNLSIPSEALKLNDLSDMGDLSRELLLSVSNTDLELEAVKNFFINSIRQVPEQSDALLKLFQDTPEGNALTQKLFDCAVNELPEKVTSGSFLTDSSVRTEPNEEKFISRPSL
ncbi:MAG TPA: hypothetical protein VHA13_04370 [Gammaproteobacteria bacterium]|nr:hypothetical protein [Gammaproteobacteria bacterium]